MKDIKTFLIGLLSCACMFLVMGATSSDANVRYQGYGVMRDRFVEHYLVDTATGETFNESSRRWVSNIKMPSASEIEKRFRATGKY